CDALSSRPAELLGRFSDWLNARPELSTEQKTCAEGWQPLDILPLQQDFIAADLRATGKKTLRQLAEDLINYHFRCAELLLAQNCQPADNLPATNQLLKQRWRLNPAVQIQRFHYDLEELEQVGGEKLSWLHKQLKKPLTEFFSSSTGSRWSNHCSPTLPVCCWPQMDNWRPQNCYREMSGRRQQNFYSLPSARACCCRLFEEQIDKPLVGLAFALRLAVQGR
ncbi:MAG: hypothetical protein GXP51_12055, partial [Deltaproteobacteria bacterium]|nr:hypothetical protein [Deltaproteobacteria bacterium]